MSMMKHRMDVEYNEAKKPNPEKEQRYVDDHKRTYGFRTKEELKCYRRGIEAASYIYDFEPKIKEYEYEEEPIQLAFPFPEQSQLNS